MPRPENKESESEAVLTTQRVPESREANLPEAESQQEAVRQSEVVQEEQREAEAEIESEKQAEQEAQAEAELEAREEELRQLQRRLQDNTTINEWSGYNNMIANRWRDDLNFNHLIYTFLLSKLKKNEGLLSWIIICISTCASTLSLIQLDDSEYEKYSIYLKVTLSISSLCTTLIAAWLKKNNYIERINTIDRYVQSLNKMITELKDILSQMPQDRMLFSEYKNKYQKKVLVIYNINCTIPRSN